MDAISVHYALVGIAYNTGIPLSLVLDVISCPLLVFNQLARSASCKLCEHVILLSYTASTHVHVLPIDLGKSHWEGGREGSLHLNDSVELKTCVHTL